MILLASLAALASSPDHAVISQDDAIYAHLDRVEARLRAADVSHLDADQQAHRAELLDVLHDYRMAGVFPHNHDGISHPRPVAVDGAFPTDAGRTPVFVDEHGTHCAVGYLLAVDGQDELVARVVAGGNLRYVHEIDEPELLAWAHEVGFSLDDLARIQPSYGEQDDDGDGWPAGSDCNDFDKNVNPDADEVCDDGVDNDCNDEIDEDACTEPSGCSSTASGASLAWLIGLSVLWRRRRA